MLAMQYFMSLRNLQGGNEVHAAYLHEWSSSVRILKYSFAFERLHVSLLVS
jgi:hypothetical protein